MKILEVNKFNYIQGGADRHFLELTQLLKSHGHEIAVFSMDNSRNDFSPWKKYFVSYVGYGEKDSAWEKIKGSLRIFYSNEARLKIGKLLDDFQPDIVHIHNIYHQISPSILPEIKKRGIPVVMTVHDYKLICPNYLLLCKGMDWQDINPQKRYAYFLRNRCFKNSYLKSLLVVLETKFHNWLNIYRKNIDLYISPSQFTKNKLVKGGIPEEKIIVVPHFVKEDSLGAKCDLRNYKKYVLHFGRLSKEKGVDKLIEIFQGLDDVNLQLAGKIEDDLQIPNQWNIKHLGFLNPEQLDAKIKNSMFVVSLSRLPETFGLIALEAMKNGKPFIGYRSAAFPEIIENDRTGYLCETEEEMKEKIKKLATDDGLRILFGRNALESAKKFSSENYYLKIMELFRKLRNN